jgi:nicotinamide riboside kinase
MRIALLGAESTGKTQLAAALTGQLARQGYSASLVAEVLREWCDRAGRTPLASEQDGIAREQAHRSDAAATGSTIVVADTTPMMIAVYSDYVFGDATLYDFALAHQRQYDVTLVTGLDLPWQADGLQRDGPHAREPVDTLLRAALLRGGIAFQTIYGQGEERLKQALAALPTPLGHSRESGHDDVMGQRVRADRPLWTCDRCSDPECEHRLFSALLTAPKR